MIRLKIAAFFFCNFTFSVVLSFVEEFINSADYVNDNDRVGFLLSAPFFAVLLFPIVMVGKSSICLGEILGLIKNL